MWGIIANYFLLHLCGHRGIGIQLSQVVGILIELPIRPNLLSQHRVRITIARTLGVDTMNLNLIEAEILIFMSMVLSTADLMSLLYKRLKIRKNGRVHPSLRTVTTQFCS